MTTPTPTPSATRAREIAEQILDAAERDMFSLTFVQKGVLTNAVATALATAEAAGWRAGRDVVVALAQDGALPIGCTADEATGVVRRTRDAIAAAGSALTPPESA